MIAVFIDESGYTGNWLMDIENQPFYVLSAVCLPMDAYPNVCADLRSEIQKLNLPGVISPLGQGFQIKARTIARGEGWWQEHNEERNKVRTLMLSTPPKYQGTAFVVIIDKTAHQRQYVNPEDPVELSLRFLFERLQMYLVDNNEYAFCVYDQNKPIDDKLQTLSTALVRDGSDFFFISGFYLKLISFKIDRISEFTLGNSTNSIGLQLADFFASFTYQYYKNNKPSPCGWWDILYQSLHKRDDKIRGIGLKEFP